MHPHVCDNKMTMKDSALDLFCRKILRGNSSSESSFDSDEARDSHGNDETAVFLRKNCNK
nr:unnamed protein product [Callosobruchus analis]